MDLNLTDEEVFHPLIVKAEHIAAEHAGIANDLFSYAKEVLSDSHQENLITLLRNERGYDYDEAKEEIEQMLKEREREYVRVGKEVMRHPFLGKSEGVRVWIRCLPYGMGGNVAWSQEVRCQLSCLVFGRLEIDVLDLDGKV